MKKTETKAAAVAVETPQEVHPLLKSHMIVSKKHVDYNNLTAFESVSMSLVLVLAVLVGVIQASTLA